MWQERIVVDPDLHHGRPVIRGTRVPVHVLVGSVAAGMGLQEIAKEYGVSVKDVQAALEYASHLVSDEEHHAFHA